MPLTWDTARGRWRITPDIDADPAAIAKDALVGAGLAVLDAARSVRP